MEGNPLIIFDVFFLRTTGPVVVSYREISPGSRYLDPQRPHEARPLGGHFTPHQELFEGFLEE